MVSWDPQVYERYAAERARPFTDLLARVDAARAGLLEPRRVVDLGCGSGELTASLAARWPGADVLGVDSSPEMLAQAATRTDDPAVRGRLRFAAGDVRTWRPDGRVDVLVTNAVLQWVPGHLELLRAWTDQLEPGGVIALQVPGNFGAPSHALMREVADEPPFADVLGGVLRGTDSVAEPVEYAGLLADAGCDVDAWETTYVHVLDAGGAQGADAVLAWVAGTGLRPVTDALAGHPALSEQFVATYGERLRAAYPRRSWGTALPFRRLFCVARKQGDRS